MNALLARVGIAVTILIGACLATWFAASAHYSKQYVALKSGYEQAARDQAMRVEELVRSNQAATKRINDEAQKQLAGRDAAIAALRLHVNAGRGAISLCPSPQGSGKPDGSQRPGVTTSPQQPTGTQGPVAIDPAVLAAALDIGIGALRSELLWRDYARSTNQTNGDVR